MILDQKGAIDYIFAFMLAILITSGGFVVWRLESASSEVYDYPQESSIDQHASPIKNSDGSSVEFNE